jgi:hypothetical protein
MLRLDLWRAQHNTAQPGCSTASTTRPVGHPWLTWLAVLAKLQVSFPAGSKKPFLETTSGEKVQIYQYNIVAGDAIVHTIKGLLVPGTSTTFAPAPAPSA